MDIRRYTPSLLINRAQDTILRFPLVVMSTVLAAIAIELHARKIHPWDFELIAMTAVIAIPFFVSSQFLRETLKFKFVRFGGDLISILIVIGFFMVCHLSPFQQKGERFFHLLLCGHLLIAFIPFIRNRNEIAFWEFNKNLFLRFFLSLLYSSVLCAGLSTIIFAINGLFGIEWSDFIYRLIWLTSFFIFHPLHFLSGVPKDWQDLEIEHQYPKALRIFSQYLLIPLISVLGMVLIVYFLKIVFTMNWPKGLVSSLIASFSIMGILTLLLLHPLTKEEGSWVRKYSKLFYFVEIFLGALMIAAVYRRINDYSFTDERYIVLVIALWILGAGTYFTVSKTKNILGIPVSLFIITAITFVGPLSPYTVGFKSQTRRMEKILQKYDLMKEGKIISASVSIKTEDQVELTSIHNYIQRTHGDSALSPWIGGRGFFEVVGFEPNYVNHNYASAYITMDTRGLSIDTKDYPFLFQFRSQKNPNMGFLAGQKIAIDLKNDDFHLFKDNELILSMTYIDMLKQAHIDLAKVNGSMTGPWIIPITAGGVKGKLYVMYASGSYIQSTGKVTMESLEGFILYTLTK